MKGGPSITMQNKTVLQRIHIWRKSPRFSTTYKNFTTSTRVALKGQFRISTCRLFVRSLSPYLCGSWSTFNPLDLLTFHPRSLKDYTPKVRGWIFSVRATKSETHKYWWQMKSIEDSVREQYTTRQLFNETPTGCSLHWMIDRCVKIIDSFVLFQTASIYIE